MASTYSTNLALELIGTGDQAGTWGLTTNTNLGTLIEQAISGYVTQAVSTGADTTITIPNGATGVARNMYIELTGTGGASTNLIVPANKKLYFIFNNTASGQVTVKVSGQTGVSVPNKAKMILVSNGTDIVDATNYIGNISAASANITTLTSASATITNLIATSGAISTLVSSDFSATVARSASATITNLLATSATVSSGSTLNGGVVINEPGADVDFRVESDTDANCLFVDASANAVGIGTSSPQYKLQVSADDTGNTFPTAAAVNVTNTNTSGFGKTMGVNFSVGAGAAAEIISGVYGVYTNYTSSVGGALAFVTNNGSGSLAEKMRLDSSGNLGLGTLPTYPTRFNITNNSVSLSTNNFITIQNLGLNTSDNTNSYPIGGLLFSGYRDVRNPSNVAGIWAERSPASGGAASAGSLIFGTQANGENISQDNSLPPERARIDASGNFGLGVTPSAWSAFKAVQVGSGSLASTPTGQNLSIAANAYFDGTNWKYVDSAVASEYRQNGGTHFWSLAPSGTAGNTITFTQAMTLDASGNLGLGTTSPGSFAGTVKLVVGSAATTTTPGAVTVYSGNATYGGLYFADGTVGNQLYRGAVEYNHSTDTLLLYSAGSQNVFLDSSGNLGLGVTPSAWDTSTNIRAMQLGGGSVYSYNNDRLFIGQNVYIKATTTDAYVGTGKASSYRQYDGTHAWFTAPSGTAGNTITFTQAMTLDASGNLGVGTTAASNVRLHTYNTASIAEHRIECSTTAGVFSRWKSSAGDIGYFGQANVFVGGASSSDLGVASAVGNIVFATGVTPAERARITSGGDLLVGTTSNGSSSRMIVNGTATGANQRILQILSTTAGDVSNSALLVSKRDDNTTTSQVFVHFSVNNDSTASGQINANGASQAAFGSWSDRRLKTNIVDLPPQLSNILALRPVEFDYIESEGGGHQINFIAQEMENVYPDAVGERQDGMKTITGWGKTEARLVKAIQEQQTMIKALEAKVAALEAGV